MRRFSVNAADPWFSESLPPVEDGRYFGNRDRAREGGTSGAGSPTGEGGRVRLLPRLIKMQAVTRHAE
jgi:hypothetical protein